MRFYVSLILLFVTSGNLFAQEKKGEKITFEDHVKPIFRDHCFSCHNQNKKEGDLDLTNFTSLMQGGGSGAVIEPGAVGDSYLFALVNHDEEPAMPPEQPKIPAAKIELLSKWIDGGALENSASKAMVKKKKTFDFALTDPAVGKPSVMPLPAKLDLEPVLHSKRATGVTAMATSPWAPLAAIAGQKQVLLYDTKTRELKGILPFPEGTVTVLKFSRNGSLLLAGGGRGGSKGLVVVWNIKNGERIIEVGDELDSVLAADISSDQKLVALGGPQKMIRVYSTADNSLVYEIKKHTDWVTSMEFSPDGVLLCTGDRNGGVHVWEAFSGREYLTLKAHSKSITGISWRSDSNIVATTSEDASIRLWEMNNGSSIRNWTAHGGGSLAVEFTRDGRIVSSGRDRYAKIWDQAGKQLFAFPVFKDIAMGVTHCDESNTCFAGDWTGEIRHFNAADGKQLATITSNPLPLAQQLATAQAYAAKLATSSQQLTAVATADKKSVDALVAAIAANKKKMTDLAAMMAKLTPKMAADQKTLAASNQSLATLKTRVSALGVAIPEMKKAKVSADAATAKLATDAELKKIAAEITKVLAAKEAELAKKNTDMAALTKQIGALTATVKTDKANVAKYNAELAAAKQALAKAQPMLKPAQDKYAKSKSAADAGVASHQAAVAAVTRWQTAISFSKTYRELNQQIVVRNEELNQLAVSHFELVEKSEEAKKKMVTTRTTYDATKAKVDAKAAEVNGLQAKIAGLVQSTSNMKTEIANTTKVMQQTQASMTHLAGAKAKLEEAKAAAPNDADLIAALNSMAALIAKQTQKVTSYQTAIKSKTDTLTKMSTELAANQQKKTAAEKTIKELQVLMTMEQKQLTTATQAVEAATSIASQAEGKVKQKEAEIAKLKSDVAKLQGI